MEHKFRFYDREDKVMRYFTLDEMLERHFAYYGSYDLKVLHEEKMQYTGLKDKNGKEIYVGDILRGEFGGYGVVKFHKSWGAFYYSMVSGRDEYGDIVPISSSKPFFNNSTNYEIVGNLCENPDFIDNHLAEIRGRSMLSHDDLELVTNLNKETNCGINLALKALAFVKENDCEDVTMIGYIKAKTLAVATPSLTFLERVKRFSK